MDLKIAVIIGSTRPTRVGNKIANWFMGEVAQTPNVDFDLIDLAKINLPFLNEPDLPAMGNYQQESTKSWSETIDSYDGFVFVVPEYNHGYSAPLKNAIDTIYHEWTKKPVAFVAYGSIGGVRAVEQLVQVTAQIAMVPLPYAQINIIGGGRALDKDGKLKPESIHGSKDKLVSTLLWWARVLKLARKQDQN